MKLTEKPTESVTSPAGRGRVQGRIALVAGGAGGIGRAVAALLVLEGARVIVADLPESDGKNVADSLGAAADFVPLDVRLADDWKNAVDACQLRFGGLPDILVQASGVMVTGAADTCSPDDLRRALEINTLGTLHGIQAVAPGMRGLKRGSIVVVTSMAGVTFGVAGLAPYTASKAAAAALIKCAALDFAGSGVRINGVVPGQIDTPMSRGSGVRADDSMFAGMPIPRSGQPQDVAHAALFLASDESSWITGTDILVDGGMEAGPTL